MAEVKSLLEICQDYIKSPYCNFEVDLNKYWMNCKMACIPFKINYWLQANEYYYCSCKRHTFNITFLKRNKKYFLASRAGNCFHCWFVMMVEIKVKKIYAKRNNIVHFASSLADFFSFLVKFKHINSRPNYEPVSEFDGPYVAFGYFLDEWAPCFCLHGEGGPF